MVGRRDNSKNPKTPGPGKSPTSTSRVAAKKALRGVALEAPRPAKSLAVGSHRAILGSFQQIATRINDDPQFSVMLLINPVLALQRYGVELAPEMQSHIFHTLQHRSVARSRRDELEASLTKQLGEPPRPDDAAWLAKILFQKLKLQPLDATGHSPVYKPPMNAELVSGLNAMRPKIPPRYRSERRLTVQASVGQAKWRPAFRRLDLDAPVPALPPAAHAPMKIETQQLWFYKDSSQIVHDLLELSIIQHQGFFPETAEGFRQIAEGKKVNAFRAWNVSVRFKTDAPP